MYVVRYMYVLLCVENIFSIELKYFDYSNIYISCIFKVFYVC